MLKSNQSHHLYGFTDLKSLNERGPLIISYGKGIYVYDIHGKQYLDANSGLWNACAGFDHPGLVEVAKNQYEKCMLKSHTKHRVFETNKYWYFLFKILKQFLEPNYTSNTRKMDSLNFNFYCQLQ